ncbi:hypothetical protein, partial [Curtobacterium sp. MCPF17_015]|uniref:hypothetical protein n=1 Tax=Curtobacterium sp. MCPF17_015 TaxID=2175662 RepID=UPI001C647891
DVYKRQEVPVCIGWVARDTGRVDVWTDRGRRAWVGSVPLGNDESIVVVTPRVRAVGRDDGGSVVTGTRDPDEY